MKRDVAAGQKERDAFSAPLDRDFVGYGRAVPRVMLPNHGRVVLNFVLNYEEGSERTFVGDGVNESLGEYPRPVEGAFRDFATESVYEYGSRVGVHRLLDLFDSRGVPCTVFAAAVALERNAEVAARIRETGHETCGHGWRWSEDWRASPEAEAKYITAAVESFTRTVGRRPVGWYSRWMPSVWTRRLLIREGGFLYDSNAYNDDLPYFVQVEGQSHLVIPYTLTYNDARYSMGHFGSPSDFVDLVQRGLRYLWKEGEVAPRMMTVALHARWSGQAGRASAVEEILDFAQSLEGVWIATREEIATWWGATYPAGRVAGQSD